MPTTRAAVPARYVGDIEMGRAGLVALHREPISGGRRRGIFRLDRDAAALVGR